MALLSITEASEAVGIHPNTLRNWLRAGLLHSYRTGERGMLYVKDKDLFRLADRMRDNPRRLLVDYELEESEIDD